MKNIKIEIDVIFANEWQKEIHLEFIENFLKNAHDIMTTVSVIPKKCRHKDNKLVYKITEEQR